VKALGKEPNPGEVVWPAWGFALVALTKRDKERAVRLYGAAEALLTVSSTRQDPLDRERAERNIALLRAELGEEAFTAAWAEGQGMSLEDALAYALSEA
jgi:hypothetical protein